MKLKYLFENASNILRRLQEAEGVRKWRFVANPQCCDTCQAMDGKIVESPNMPVWYGHVPNEPGRFNCRCKWVPADEFNGEQEHDEEV